MERDIVIQSLTESFEVLKDSWASNKDAIINCIVETEVYDGKLAMDMWHYILQTNLNLLEDKEESEHLVNDVFNRFLDKYERYCDTKYYCRVVLEHIVVHLIQNESLINVLFGKTFNAGYVSEYQSFISICIAGIILQDNPHIIQTLFGALSKNTKIVDISIGQLLLKANKYIETVKQNQDTFKLSYSVTARVKEALLSCLDLIKDKKTRAECTIAIIAY